MSGGFSPSDCSRHFTNLSSQVFRPRLIVYPTIKLNLNASWLGCEHASCHACAWPPACALASRLVSLDVPYPLSRSGDAHCAGQPPEPLRKWRALGSGYVTCVTALAASPPGGREAAAETPPTQCVGRLGYETRANSCLLLQTVPPGSLWCGRAGEKELPPSAACRVRRETGGSWQKQHERERGNMRTTTTSRIMVVVGYARHTAFELEPLTLCR